MDKPLAILREYFGHTDFRGIQREIIDSICAGHDTLGLMPTGGGKSITFQVPALAMEGVCVVISPLIALMKDQVAHLRAKGIKAVAVHTGMTREEVIIALENCIFGSYKFLYVSPERLSSGLFRTKLSHMHISFITVDEAHCISQWGYDFRPAYLHIADIRKLVPDVPILALTATATPEVVKDIQQQLQFRQENVRQMSFRRTNLAYSVRRVEDTKEQEVFRVLSEIPGCAIVYTRSRKGAREIALGITRQGVSATYYHAGLTPREKNERQTAWQNDEVRVMVATNAFGMGIDKADVRCVVHVDVPDSPEAYFQEAGRAGRDGQLAHAVLLAEPDSRAILLRRIEDTFPPREYVAKVYEDVCFYLQMAMGDGYGVTRRFDLEEFCRTFKHFPTRAYSALQLLDRAGYLAWADAEESNSRVKVLATRDELYSYQIPPLADRILGHLLRSYTGIFSDYAFIHEDHIAEALGVRSSDISEQLIMLSRRHIISFIPREFIPHVTFLQRRVEPEEIYLSPAVYDERKRQLASRVETMVGYLKTTECRSCFLLHYFGEEQKEPCGLCDNCAYENGMASEPQSDYLAHASKEQIDSIRKRIIDMLKESGPTPVAQIRFEGMPDRLVVQILRQMLAEEEICYQNSMPILMLKLPV